jgi:excisionase family DNA binding protein
VADLLADAATALRALAEGHENQLAVAPERAVMAPVKRPPLLSVRDVAEILGVDARTVRRWREERKLPPALTVGGIVRWERADIEAWIAARTAS